MILGAIRKLYEGDGSRPSTGNPTGSRFGTCAAQLQLLRFPELSAPEPPSARRRINFEAGDRIEAWWGSVIERAFPNVSGLAQEPFYFPVPISGPDFDRLAPACAMRQNAAGLARLWGTVIPGFAPPSVREHLGRLKVHLVARDRDGTAPRKLGFVLDPDGGPMLWAPTYVDRVIKHPEYGLRVLEKKMHRLTDAILTPAGWIKAGDVAVGDTFIAVDGTRTRVTGVFPKSAAPLWRLRFSDGATFVTSDEHLWSVESEWRERHRGRESLVVTTAEIRRKLDHGGPRWSIPVLSQPAELDAHAVPLDPYLVGAFLGDGGITGATMYVTTADDEVLTAIRAALPDGVELVRSSRYSYRVRAPRWYNPIRWHFSKLGILGQRSWEKHIPDLYLWNSADVRLAVLQGLLDTDGWVVHHSSSVGYATTSERLADGVEFLVRSLGGIVTRRTVVTTYTYRGEKRSGRPSARLTINLPPSVPPFRLSRKLAWVRPKATWRHPRRYIVGYEPAGEEAGVCFHIEHPTHLYVANDFVVTHNSMSDWGFRRALLGRLDYGYRCQLAGLVKATGLDVVLLAYRKETGHLAELAYARGAAESRVDIYKLNGQVETYFARGQDEALETFRPCACGGRTPDCGECGGAGQVKAALPHDQEWDLAEAWTPYDESLIHAIQERVRRVLLWDGSRATLWREYGPSFLCPKCGGAGKRTCPQCKGTGKTPKKGNPCGPCGGAMTVVCETCAGASILAEAVLGFPCSYAIPPDMPVLLADYTWRVAGKLVPGDRVWSVSEQAPGERRDRKMEVGTVLAMAPRRHVTVGLDTPRGTIVCSPEHPWLVKSAGLRPRWRRAADIRPGWQICWLTEPHSVDIDDERYMGGYVRGLVDGDGSVQDRSGHPTVRVAMADPEPLERLVWFLQYFGVRAWIEPFSAYSRRPMEQVRFGGIHADPSRLATRLLAWPIDNAVAAAGYLAGLYDAEGSIGRWSLRIHQIASSPVTARVLQATELLGLDFRLEKWRRGTHRHIGAVRFYSRSFTSSLIRFFCRTRPALARKCDVSGRGVMNAWEPVTAVASGGEADLVDVQVSSRTFVAGGFASHNCPAIHACLQKPDGSPLYRLEVTDKPKHIVARADWQAAGLTFAPPERESV